MRFLASDIARLTDGSLVGDDVEIDGASIDSRSIEQGNLFVPIVADRDGHDFVPAAIGAGAVAYLRSRPVPEAVDAPAIEVDDTAAGLTALGVAARHRLDGANIVGITGSVGKTSVKDLVAAATGAARRTHANVGSFNNELGLPLTLIDAPADTEVAVLEMGARGVGHIRELCAIGRPTIGVVTRVASAHTELFGSLDAVADAKGELVEALPASGTAVLNADDPRVAAMSARTTASVLTFGDGGDVRPTAIHLDELLRPRFLLETPFGSAQVRLPSAGRPMAYNAAAAVAAGLAAEIELDALVAGLEQASVSRWRMEVTTTPVGAVIVNDAYNANPASMRAALDGLAAIDRTDRVAVLGVMAELGDEHDDAHREMAELALSLGIRVVAVAAPDYGPDVVHVADMAGALKALGPLGADSAVLLKGSRVAGLERLASVITGLAE